MPSAFTPTDTIGISAGLMRSTSGSSISRGSSLADRRHLAPDILRRHLRRHFQSELDDDAGDAFLRRRLDVTHAFDGVDRFLDLARHVAFHGLRRRARVARGDGDDRELDFGELVDVELLVRADAEDGERRHHHRREHRLFDGEVAQEHDDSPLMARRRRGCAAGAEGAAAALLPCTCTVAPEVSDDRRIDHHGLAARQALVT